MLQTFIINDDRLYLLKYNNARILSDSANFSSGPRGPTGPEPTFIYNTPFSLKLLSI